MTRSLDRPPRAAEEGGRNWTHEKRRTESSRRWWSVRRARDRRDAAAFADLFHPDTVWPWPPTAHDHDPSGWVFVMVAKARPRAAPGHARRAGADRSRRALHRGAPPGAALPAHPEELTGRSVFGLIPPEVGGSHAQRHPSVLRFGVRPGGRVRHPLRNRGGEFLHDGGNLAARSPTFRRRSSSSENESCR